MLAVVCSPVLINSTLIDNRADGRGGAVLLYQSREAKVLSSSLVQNVAGGLGGAMFVEKGLLLQISDSAFDGNRALLHGGALAILDSPLAVTKSSFTRNQAVTHGGAVYITSQSLEEAEGNEDIGGGACSQALTEVDGSTVMRQNVAFGGGGGAVYADVRFSLEGMARAKMFNNSARYGDDVATGPSFLRLVNWWDIASSLHSFEEKMEMDVEVLDFFGQRVKSDESVIQVSTMMSLEEAMSFGQSGKKEEGGGSEGSTMAQGAGMSSKLVEHNVTILPPLLPGQTPRLPLHFLARVSESVQVSGSQAARASEGVAHLQLQVRAEHGTTVFLSFTSRAVPSGPACSLLYTGLCSCSWVLRGEAEDEMLESPEAGDALRDCDKDWSEYGSCGVTAIGRVHGDSYSTWDVRQSHNLSAPQLLIAERSISSDSTSMTCVSPYATSLETNSLWSFPVPVVMGVCPAGEAFSVSRLSCERCSTGRYADRAGSLHCSSCPAGRYQPDEGATRCLPCSSTREHSSKSGSRSCVVRAL